MTTFEVQEACRHLRKKTPIEIAAKKKALLARRFSKTEYTGLIKSTKDLAYWASVSDWKHRCRWCGRGIDHYGLCLDCEQQVTDENRCLECFDKIVDEWASTCATCLNKDVHVGNPHGYKEGGDLSGGLRTNFKTDNHNDNNAKSIEESR